jgi:hypothetical protein
LIRQGKPGIPQKGTLTFGKQERRPYAVKRMEELA